MEASKGGVEMSNKTGKRRMLGIIAGLSLLAMVTTACGTLFGAAVGAGAGAAIGEATGHGAKKGALIGAGVGGAAGAIYDLHHGL